MKQTVKSVKNDVSCQAGRFGFSFSRPLKKRLLPVFFACAFGLAGCAQSPKLLNQTFVFELGSDVYGNPALYIENPELYDTASMRIEPASGMIRILDNRFVTVSQEYLGVGEYEFVLKDRNNEIPFVIKVKDTQPPKTQNSPDSLTVAWGSDVDWDSVYQATDLSGVYYDIPPEALYTVGEQDIEVKISDRFGNAVFRPLHLVVTQ